MFDIDSSGLLLMFVIGLIVLGPQRSPATVKTIAGRVRALRSLATTVQNGLTQELKPQEFQDSLKKVEKVSLVDLTPELKASINELHEAVESMKRSYNMHDLEEVNDETHTIHNPMVKDGEAQQEGVTLATTEDRASSSEREPESAGVKAPGQTENTPVTLIDVEKKTAAPVVEFPPSSSDKS